MGFLVATTFLFCFLSSCGQKVKEKFLVFARFQGRINVVFNQPSAAPIPVENRRKVYRIPADGILVTSSKLETGFIDRDSSAGFKCERRST
jgi:hypothetical protein